MPSADDFSDYLERVKEAEEVGLTAAEVWRNLAPEIPGLDRYQDETLCRRCKRPTTPDFRSPYCYSCERNFFGDES